MRTRWLSGEALAARQRSTRLMRYFLGAGVLAVLGVVGNSTSDSNAATDAGSTVDSGGLDSGGGDAGGGDAACSPEPDQSGHAQAMAEAVCAPHAGCCTQIGLGFDTTACVQELAPRYQVFFDGARCRGGQYVPSAVAECIAALEAYAGSCPMNYGTGDLGELYHRADRACAAVFDGISEPGEPCDSDLDCVQTPGSVTECDSGQCVRTVWGQEGSSCDTSAEPIATDCDKYDGLICRKRRVHEARRSRRVVPVTCSLRARHQVRSGNL